MQKKKDIINLQGQQMYGPDELKEELAKLRAMIRNLAQAADTNKHCIDLEEYASCMWVLNWLIEEVEFN